MRLLTKTTLYFLLLMVPLLAAAGFYLFGQFSKELNQRSDDELVSDEIQWIRYLQNEAAAGTTFILRTADIDIYPVSAEPTAYPSISDTDGFSAKANRKVPYRQLSHVVSIGGIPYQIIIRKSQEQKTVLVANVTRIMLFVFAGLFVATLLFNWFISRGLWQPFRQSLGKIRAVELNKMEAIHFDETNIEEFNELNASLNAMTSKIYSDYVNMKEFTENAAHEMQTPLAVVQGKLELLLQDTNLTDEQVHAIVQASDALTRLSKLNQSLLLLAKIENHQYEALDTVSLTDTAKKYLRFFEDVIKDKQLRLEAGLNEDFRVNLHPFLAESLVSNLVGNAIKYNYQGGQITIIMKADKMMISNTSHLHPIDQQQLFKRFNRAKAPADNSTGLGLAIVKKICDTSQLTIAYSAANGVHRFEVQKA